VPSAVLERVLAREKGSDLSDAEAQVVAQQTVLSLIASCTDLGAISRDAPAVFFYQVRAYCDALTEGP